MRQPALPPGFVLDQSSAPALPPGFVLDDGESDQPAAPRIDGGGSRTVEGAARPVSQAAQGINEGLARAIGTPVSAVNLAADLVGIPVSDEPFMGQNWVMSRFRDAGFINPEDGPRNMTERVIRRAGEEVGASVPFVAAIGRAGQGANAINATQRAAQEGGAFRGLVAPAVEQAARRPGATAAADMGLSAVSGVGAEIGQQAGGTTGELLGSVAAPLAVVGAPGAARRLVGGGRPESVAVANDFAASGTSPTVGQLSAGVEGRPTAPALVERVAGNAPGGNVRLARALERQQEEIGRRVQSIANDLAPGADAERAGRAVQSGAEDFVGRMQTRATELYGAVDEAIDPAAQVSLRNTLDYLQSVSQSTPGLNQTGPLLHSPAIRQYAEALTADAGQGGVIPYQSLARVRSAIGQQLRGQSLVSDAREGELRALYSALTNDMEAAARASGDEAYRRWQRANRHYQAWNRRVSDFLDPINRQNVPERVYLALEQGGRQGATRIRAIRRSLTPQQWDHVAAAMISRMGRATPSNQGADVDTFSTETFLTNWARMDQEARNQVFGGDRYRRYRQDLNSIARTAETIRTSQGILANPSGSAQAGVNIGAGVVALSSLMTGDVGMLGATGSAVVASDVAARLMSNPRFVSWLAQTNRQPVERYPVMLGRLASTIASDDQQYAEDLRAFLDAQRALTQEQPRGDGRAEQQ